MSRPSLEPTSPISPTSSSRNGSRSVSAIEYTRTVQPSPDGSGAGRRCRAVRRSRAASVIGGVGRRHGSVVSTGVGVGGLRRVRRLGRVGRVRRLRLVGRVRLDSRRSRCTSAIIASSSPPTRRAEHAGPPLHRRSPRARTPVVAPGSPLGETTASPGVDRNAIRSCHTHPPAYATNCPVVNRLLPSTNGAAKCASSSSVPRRPIGTASLDTRATLRVLGAVRAQELGEVHEVRADRVDLHAVLHDLRGDVAHEHVRGRASRRVERRARRRACAGGAREQQDLSVASGRPSPARPRGGSWYGASTQPTRVVREVVDRRAQEPPDGDSSGERRRRVDPTEARHRRADEACRRVGVGEVARPLDPSPRSRRRARARRPARAADRRARDRDLGRRAVGRAAARRSSTHPDDRATRSRRGRWPDELVRWTDDAGRRVRTESVGMGARAGRGVRELRRDAGQHAARHRDPDHRRHDARQPQREAAQDGADARRARRRVRARRVGGRCAEEPGLVPQPDRPIPRP